MRQNLNLWPAVRQLDGNNCEPSQSQQSCVSVTYTSPHKLMFMQRQRAYLKFEVLGLYAYDV